MSSSRPPGYAALRRHRHSLPHHVYHLTSITVGRAPIFKARAAIVVARDFAASALWGDAKPLAWVVMPDHAHWLVQLGRRDALEVVMGRIKSATARHVRMCQPDICRVWASGYHERQIRTDDDLACVAEYIIMNPVRAGLVSRVEDYPFWNSEFV